MRESDAPASERKLFSQLNAALNVWLSSSDQPSVQRQSARLDAEWRVPPQAFLDMDEREIRLWLRDGDNWRFVDRFPKVGDATESLKYALRQVIHAGFATRNGHLELAVFSDEIVKLPIGIDLSLSPARSLRLGMDISVTVRIRDRWVDRELWNNWHSCWEEGKDLLEQTSTLDWLDRRKMEQSENPTSWVSLHDLDDACWLERFLGKVWNGAPWALACRPAAPDDFRNLLGEKASLFAVEEWMKLAKTVRDTLKSAASTQNVLFVADSLPLPPGVADFLSVPEMVEEAG
jgi:hypothetical protein